MRRKKTLELASLLGGLLSLYVGWGEGLGFVLLGPDACEAVGPPRGLHLNEVGQLVYRRCQYVYDFAWPVFALVTLLGISLLGNAARLNWAKRHS